MQQAFLILGMLWWPLQWMTVGALDEGWELLQGLAIGALDRDRGNAFLV